MIHVDIYDWYKLINMLVCSCHYGVPFSASFSSSFLWEFPQEDRAKIPSIRKFALFSSEHVQESRISYGYKCHIGRSTLCLCQNKSLLSTSI